ncbi:MAG: hypothetical protein KDC37_05950, partial [Flavobacteriales bacterium]|nr:hypothetical protein [Flavobacteriales bacterium]
MPFAALMPKIQILTPVFWGLALLMTFACKKDNLGRDTSSQLSFSTRQVFFDTVFTGVGTVTRRLMIYNNSDREILISGIALEGMAGSTFRFNVDGVAGTQRDILLRSRDSLFAFVEATINPANTNQPFVVEDNLVFEVNGHVQKVQLIAWGRDAYYHRPTQLIQGFPPFSYLSEYGYRSMEVVWTNDKPHIIYGYLMVDSLLTLRMEAGTRVYFHQNAGLWVYRGGALRIEGEKNAEVVLQGDRLEPSFEDVGGQWDRIWINEGAASYI